MIKNTIKNLSLENKQVKQQRRIIDQFKQQTNF